MPKTDRRQFLQRLALSGVVLHPAIARALEIPAANATGTIKDVEHVVILTQENRAFDHYFGAFPGVRGFGDRFPIPRPDAGTIKGKTVWLQPNEHTGQSPAVIAPFPLNTRQTFEHMRMEGTPHTWPDAQAAWDDGRLSNWPGAKHNHAMGYFTGDDLPFQYALAEGFTLCDAYHCALHAGTNPNRVFIWTGTNDPSGAGHGPVITNDYDNLRDDKDGHGGYAWTTYAERLQAAGISWQIYQNMADNFTDNPLAGFKRFRDADRGVGVEALEIAERSLRTRDLDKLKQDVVEGKLPQVSWIVATAEGSEHPGPSSPAQGADYTARVLDALTANPAVWSKTVLLLNFDENDGFFDHVPPPAPPSRDPADPHKLWGASDIDTTGEYHVHGQDRYLGRAYGLGPRVPLYVISPWSRGGFVNSQVFDHTSVIRFLEARFGVMEPNISAWRRAVSGDLTSCFDFKTPNSTAFFEALPQTAVQAKRARGLLLKPTPKPPEALSIPVQPAGPRLARPLPYALEAACEAANGQITLRFRNDSDGGVAAVFHLYDRRNLSNPPRRYTIAAKSARTDGLPAEADGRYDLWLIGPNGFHRHFQGHAAEPAITLGLAANPQAQSLRITLTNSSPAFHNVTIRSEVYDKTLAPTITLVNGLKAAGPFNATVGLSPGQSFSVDADVSASRGWYDLIVSAPDAGGYSRRFAGHIETGRVSISDPAAFGPAHTEQTV